MATPPERPAPRAGGAILAITVIAGAVVGGIAHQPSIGILVGAATGIAIAIAIWLADRRRTRGPS